MTDIAKDRLRSIDERIERMNEEIENLQEDRKEIYSEAKQAGYDVKTLRQIIKIRKADKQELTEQEMLLETYPRALDMIAPLPLFSRDAAELPLSNREAAE